MTFNELVATVIGVALGLLAFFWLSSGIVDHFTP